MLLRSSSGFSLIEVAVATSLLAVGVCALAYLTLAAGQAARAARDASMAQRLAREKMEQLRALAWTSDGAVLPVSDWSTDLTAAQPAPTGGVGLGVSPPDSLASGATGFADYVDVRGQWLAGGPIAPPGSAWVRRWSVERLESSADTLVLQVLVAPIQTAPRRRAPAMARSAIGAWLVDLRTRRAR